ncbi:hypothetical protein VNO77_19963 [Canavalia gladiata]|uniref:Uncharacterized protein n=1 Tax=Canavalia gladiata TaxID=3824 RepID=A0AAN9QIY4_CANGL
MLGSRLKDTDKEDEEVTLGHQDDDAIVLRSVESAFVVSSADEVTHSGHATPAPTSICRRTKVPHPENFDTPHRNVKPRSSPRPDCF